MTKEKAKEVRDYLRDIDSGELEGFARKETEHAYGRPQLDDLQRALANTSANLAELVEYIERYGADTHSDDGERERKAALLAMTSLVTCLLKDIRDRDPTAAEKTTPPESFSTYLRKIMPDEMSAHYRRMSHLLKIEMDQTGKPTVELVMTGVRNEYPGGEQLIKDIFISFDNSEGFSEELANGTMIGATMMFWMMKGLAEVQEFQQALGSED